MAMKIPVSFKKNEKNIYDYLKGKVSPTVYIKELIIKDMKEKEVSEKKKTTNLLDF